MFSEKYVVLIDPFLDMVENLLSHISARKVFFSPQKKSGKFEKTTPFITTRTLYFAWDCEFPMDP